MASASLNNTCERQSEEDSHKLGQEMGNNDYIEAVRDEA